MRRIGSRAVLLKKRVKAVQAKAAFSGLLYLLGIALLAALSAVYPALTGTAIDQSGKMPVLGFYKPFLALVELGIKNLTVQAVLDALVALGYLVMLLVMAIGFLTSCTKLGWLFKRRASYANGFNRNAYAMDYIADRFSSAFAAFVCVNLLTYLLTDGAKIGTFAYVTLAVGLFIHFVAGMLGGTVTTFTVGAHVEEEEREHGVLVYFIRNLLQLIVAAVLVFLLARQSVLLEKVSEVLDRLLVNKAAFDKEFLKGLIPVGVELVMWVFITVLITHATAETEYNRECMYGAGMHNFAVFSMLTFIASVAMIVLPYANLGLANEGGLNKTFVIIAAVALAAFILDLVVRSYQRGDYDEIDMEEYIRNSDLMQYNY